VSATEFALTRCSTKPLPYISTYSSTLHTAVKASIKLLFTAVTVKHTIHEPAVHFPSHNNKSILTVHLISTFKVFDLHEHPMYFSGTGNGNEYFRQDKESLV
jgi:hypothetical protein